MKCTKPSWPSELHGSDPCPPSNHQHHAAPAPAQVPCCAHNISPSMRPTRLSGSPFLLPNQLPERNSPGPCSAPATGPSQWSSQHAATAGLRPAMTCCAPGPGSLACLHSCLATWCRPRRPVLHAATLKLESRECRQVGSAGLGLQGRAGRGRVYCLTAVTAASACRQVNSSLQTAASPRHEPNRAVEDRASSSPQQGDRQDLARGGWSTPCQYCQTVLMSGS